jgi:hypothetical protein
MLRNKSKEICSRSVERAVKAQKREKNPTYSGGRNPKLQIDIICVVGWAIDFGVALVCGIGDVPLFFVGAKRLHVDVDD